MVKIAIQKLNNDLDLPDFATAGSAGVDLLAAVNENFELKPLQRCLVPCGIKIALPEGYEAQIRSRSGLALKHGISVLNSPGTIDSDYRGEIKVILMNFGQTSFNIKRGMRIAQMIVSRFNKIIWDAVDAIYETKRGEGGFGSTG